MLVVLGNYDHLLLEKKKVLTLNLIIIYIGMLILNLNFTELAGLIISTVLPVGGPGAKMSRISACLD